MSKLNNRTLIRLNNVDFGYTKDNIVLSNINLEINTNDHIAIIGNNGSGKSTLGKILGGLLKPTNGDIYFKNLKLNSKNIYSYKEKVGLVFENPNFQFVGLTVEDDIAFGLENKQIPRDKMQSIIEEVAGYTGINALLKFSPKQLSGGQQQLVAISSIMAMNPDVYIFDEVTSMMDCETKNKIYNIIKFLKQKLHKTIITITHDMEEAASADKVLVIDKGKTVLFDKPNAVFKATLLSKLSIDKPFKNKLDEALSVKLPKQSLTKINVLPTNNLVCENLKISIGNSKRSETIIDSFNYKFEKGKTYAIIGKSGVGKTTLVSHFNGLKKAKTGNIYIGELNILSKKKKIKQHKQIVKKVGLVFQFPSHQIFKNTVEKDIGFGPTNFYKNKQEIKSLVIKNMELVGLDNGKLQHNPFDLSNGQQRLVAIAGVLANEPDIIIFDEPMSGLDLNGKIKIVNIINKLKSDGKTIIFITHDMDTVLELADQVLVLGDKKLVASGDPYSIFLNEKLSKSLSICLPQIISYLKQNKKLNKLLSYQPKTINDLSNLMKKGGF